MKKTRRANVKIPLTVTVIFLILIGVFCTSSAKIQNRGPEPIEPPVTDPVITQPVQTAPPPETIGPIDHDATGVTDTGNQSEDTTVTDEPTTTAKPVITDPDKETFKPYSRSFGANETLIGEYYSNEAAVIISKVSSGDLNYFICDITVAKAKALHTAFAGGVITGRAYTSKTASLSGATFAVNGDFCGFRTTGVIIREGMLYRNKGSEWDLCYINKYGDIKTVKNDAVNGQTLVSEGALQSWCFGPTLVKDYRALTTDEMVRPNLSSRANEPRTAIGQVDDLHYIILVVDAVRTTTKTIGGMSFAQLADTFESLGCKTAYNLDGGGSTTLYFKGQVINVPCMSGERAVSDIIYIK